MQLCFGTSKQNQHTAAISHYPVVLLASLSKMPLQKYVSDDRITQVIMIMWVIYIDQCLATSTVTPWARSSGLRASSTWGTSSPSTLRGLSRVFSQLLGKFAKSFILKFEKPIKSTNSKHKSLSQRLPIPSGNDWICSTSEILKPNHREALFQTSNAN